jgi:hypothetical protein
MSVGHHRGQARATPPARARGPHHGRRYPAPPARQVTATTGDTLPVPACVPHVSGTPSRPRPAKSSWSHRSRGRLFWRHPAGARTSCNFPGRTPLPGADGRSRPPGPELLRTRRRRGHEKFTPWSRHKFAKSSAPGSRRVSRPSRGQSSMSLRAVSRSSGIRRGLVVFWRVTQFLSQISSLVSGASNRALISGIPAMTRGAGRAGDPGAGQRGAAADGSKKDTRTEAR